MPTADDIRNQFIDFFVKKHGHANVPSSPAVPHNDPTLLFANAGMNQFKPYFLGTEPPQHTRVANTQKCIRAGGKHNDLDDVGKDTYHHTFFEMLGNWSFGDYFKQDAINWAWELLTVVWKLDPQRIHATYFQGDPAEGLEPDHEAKQLWLQYLPPERVHPGNKKDNFWEMGDTGPCGPCSELHYDGTPGINGGHLVNASDPDVIEVWNLVFIQYNRTASGKLETLPAKHVDTGMGFERIVRVLQGKSSNYDTDVFQPLFTAIQKATGAPTYTGELEKPADIAYRVIADHIRTLTFALTDGAHCGNEGRNYVLRRILRRAVRYGRQTLGQPQPFFHTLVPTVVETFGDAFPELRKNPDAVMAELRDEEESFGKTLDRGIALFEDAALRAASVSERGMQPSNTAAASTPAPVAPLPNGRGSYEISAHDAFTLHDTYGFPLDLTQLMADERGMTVDTAGFDKLMDEAREKSRAGSSTSGSAKQSLVDAVQKLSLKDTLYVGDDTTELAAEPMGITLFKLTGDLYEPAEQLSAGDHGALVLDKSPFYGESGGQVGDTGSIQIHADPKRSEGSGSARFTVTDTQRVGNVLFHLGQLLAGTLTASASSLPGVSLAVHKQRRYAIMSNHTSTHLMNRALRDHVSTDIHQRGSLVNEHALRFDFSHNHALTEAQVQTVEEQVNADIAANLRVSIAHAPQIEAIKIAGLRAVFGEKYPPTVRVVSIGAAVRDLLADPSSTRWADKSIEFCGGTHLPSTGLAECFVIASQESVSKGVRRLTAYTSHAAAAALRDAQSLDAQLTQLDAAAPGSLASPLETLTKELDEATLPLRARAALRAKLSALQDKLKASQKAQGAAASEHVVEHARVIADAADDALVVAVVPDADANTLRSAMDVIRKKRPAAAVFLLAAPAPDKVALMASVPEALIKQGLKAGDWVKHVAPIVGGGGGGRPDSAQAGGKDASKINDAIEAAKGFALKF